MTRFYRNQVHILYSINPLSGRSRSCRQFLGDCGVGDFLSVLIINEQATIFLTGANFINILHVHFAPIFWCQKITKMNVTREKLLNLLLYKKLEHKMLMKLTHGCCRRFCLLRICIRTFM
jgi:hypothetical protein